MTNGHFLRLVLSLRLLFCAFRRSCGLWQISSLLGIQQVPSSSGALFIYLAFRLIRDSPPCIFVQMRDRNDFFGFSEFSKFFDFSFMSYTRMLGACEWDSRPLTNVLGYVHKIWSKCEMLPRPKGLRRRRWKFVKYSHFVNVTVHPFPQTLFENSYRLGFLVCYNISAETCLCKQKRNVLFEFFCHWAGHNWLAWIANRSFAYESLTFATPPFMPLWTNHLDSGKKSFEHSSALLWERLRKPRPN